jgi:hypothetical protein
VSPLSRNVFGDTKLARMVKTLQTAVTQSTAADGTAVAQIGQKADAAAQAAASAVGAVTTLQLTAEDYTKRVTESAKDRADLHTQLDQVAARKVTQAVGRVATPVLLLGATQDLVVPLSRPMPNTTYEVDLLPALALLGKATFTVKAKTTTNVTVTLKAAVALTTTGSADLFAWYYG